MKQEEKSMLCSVHKRRWSQQVSKKKSEEKDGKECTESIFERAAQIMKNNVQN